MGRAPSSGRHGRRPQPSGPRRNERIRVSEVRVVGPEGTMIGVMPTKKALELAKEVGLDLVEVAPTAKPPVCRILDFGKYRYELSKKQKESKATAQKMKEVKFRVKIDTHDYMTKIRRAEDFLAKGNKLKLTLMFRGREMEHTELGFETIKRATEDLQGVATADSEPRLAGRNVSVTLSPLPEHRRQRQFTAAGEELSGEEEEENEASVSES